MSLFTVTTALVQASIAKVAMNINAASSEEAEEKAVLLRMQNFEANGKADWDNLPTYVKVYDVRLFSGQGDYNPLLEQNQPNTIDGYTPIGSSSATAPEQSTDPYTPFAAANPTPGYTPLGAKAAADDYYEVDDYDDWEDEGYDEEEEEYQAQTGGYTPLVAQTPQDPPGYTSLANARTTPEPARDWGCGGSGW